MLNDITITYFVQDENFLDISILGCYVPSMSQERILIVDDDQLLRELYVDILTTEGYVVDQARNGEEGFKKIKEGGYGLVLLDIIMPKLNGLDIMRQIKTDPPKNPNKKIVFLTNLDNEEQIREALKLGNGYLIKSQITPGNLVEEVQTYLKEEKLPTQNSS